MELGGRAKHFHFFRSSRALPEEEEQEPTVVQQVSTSGSKRFVIQGPNLLMSFVMTFRTFAVRQNKNL